MHGVLSILTAGYPGMQRACALLAPPCVVPAGHAVMRAGRHAIAMHAWSIARACAKQRQAHLGHACRGGQVQHVGPLERRSQLTGGGRRGRRGPVVGAHERRNREVEATEEGFLQGGCGSQPPNTGVIQV